MTGHKVIDVEIRLEMYVGMYFIRLRDEKEEREQNENEWKGGKIDMDDRIRCQDRKDEEDDF